MFRYVSISPEREKQACEDYKFAFSAKGQEFSYLYKRADHYITFNWLLTAFYVPAFVLALTTSTSVSARQFILLYLMAISIVGILAAILSYQGLRQAMVAIKRYLKNLQELENELGKENPFIRDVTLGRIPDSLGNFWEHEASLRFHKMLPYLVCAFWILQIFFAVNIPLV